MRLKISKLHDQQVDIALERMLGIYLNIIENEIEMYNIVLTETFADRLALCLIFLCVTSSLLCRA